MTPPHPAGGETEEEKQRVDLLENQLMDLRMNFARLCYSPDFVSAPGGVTGGRIPPSPRGCPPTRDTPPAARGTSLSWLQPGGDAPGFWGAGGSSTPKLCSPRRAGEAEAGVPGAAAPEAAGAVAVPGLPALVRRAEGKWGTLGGFGESLWGLTPAAPPPDHLRGLPGVRRAGPAAHVRARVSRAEGKPGPVPAALRGEQGRAQPPPCPGPICAPGSRCPHPPPPLCQSPSLAPQCCVPVPSQPSSLNPRSFCLHPHSCHPREPIPHPWCPNPCP